MAVNTLSQKQKNRRLFLGMFVPLLTLAVLVCTFFGIICGQIVRYYVRSETEKSMKDFSTHVSEIVQPSIDSINDFADFALKHNDPEILSDLVHTYGKNLEYIDSFYYATIKSRFEKGGLYLDSSDFVPESTWEPRNYDWFKDTIANGTAVLFQPPEKDETDGTLSATISKTVVDRHGKAVGIVGVDLVMEGLSEFANEFKISENSKVHIVMSDGSYMTNSDIEKIMSANYFEETKLKIDSESYFAGEYGAFTNAKNFYGYAKVKGTPWYVVTEGPLKEFTRRIFNMVYMVEVFAALFAIVAAIFNLRTIAKLRKSERIMGETLYAETQNLVVATKETAATSQDQSAAVKEIVATMEDSNALSESIATKIGDVSKVAMKTSTDVTEGVQQIEKNVAQLHAIFDANQQTIEGMKILSEHIESIWDIVTLINNVADQAKIIAFNAELEASSAGEAGKSFRIVANEIRRLSDGIIDGTKEIKERITEIQHSSDSLILASESGTEKITAGYTNAKALGGKFESIKASAEITADSANEITEIIQQQATASEQILIALRQISAGVENFTVATDNISESSEHIRAMSENLNSNLVEKKKRGKAND